MVMYVSNQCTSVIYCTFLITGKKTSIVSIVMLYHLSLWLHVHNYYVQLCLFYHNAANILCFTLLLYYICYTYANCNNPLHNCI